MKTDLDALDVSERRLLLVATDSTYQQLVNAIDWKKVGKGVGFLLVPWAAPLGGVAATALLPKLAASAYYGATVATSSDRIGRLSFKKLYARGEIPLPHGSPKEVLQRFTFDLGEPVDGRVYVSNPCSPDHYLLPAVADERLAQEKLSAFVEMCASLGARSIEAVSADEDSTSAEDSVSLKDVAESVGLNTAFSSTNNRERSVAWEFERPNQEPAVPERAEAWIRQDPILRSFAMNRLRAGALTASATVRIESTSGLDGKLAAELEGFGISIGGRYRSVQSGSFNFKVHFWPKSEAAA